MLKVIWPFSTICNATHANSRTSAFCACPTSNFIYSQCGSSGHTASVNALCNRPHWQSIAIIVFLLTASPMRTSAQLLRLSVRITSSQYGRKTSAISPVIMRHWMAIVASALPWYHINKVTIKDATEFGILNLSPSLRSSWTDFVGVFSACADSWSRNRTTSL